MSAQSLRLHDLNDLSHRTASIPPEMDCCSSSQVRVSAGDVLPLLADAALTNRAWIEDFADDTMEIPQDLYEVLLAYRRFRQSAA
ncbi:MAG: hypothetical protein IT422_30140 [Pirellulaceae bacterium]|jgi:hypothetical protein|nr:hypothetical protein [Pirellulaceae bacterium]